MTHQYLRSLALGGLLIALGVPCTMAQQPTASPVKVMFIGDSITSGKGYCWRYHVWQKLQENGYTAVDFVGTSGDQPYAGEFDRDHEGYGGKTADEVLKLSAAGIAKHQPDVAFIHLGTNDWAMHKQPMGEVAGEVKEIVANLRKANPQVSIHLAQIPFVPEEQGAAMQALAQQATTPAAPVHTLDLRSGWQMEPGNDTVDYVHPNLTGVLKISDRVYEALVGEVKRRGVAPGAPAVKPSAPSRENLALAKPATASAKLPGQKAPKAVDGDWKTLWAADAGSPQWVQVDLEQPQAVGGTGIMWDTAGAPYGYKVETSLDGNTWQPAADHTEAPTGISVALQPQVDEFTTRDARYIRVTITKVPNASWTKYPAALRELQVYGGK